MNMENKCNNAAEEGYVTNVLIMRKVLTLTILCLVLTVAKAQHSLQQIVMKVALRQDGSAMVTELRKMQVGTQGTEGFITFNNIMDDIEVTDLKVTDDRGTDYMVEDKWNTKRSREEKKGRCGYNRTSNGMELCWGIGDSGERIYKIQYTLKNLVKAYNDYDGFCHSFYETGSLPAKRATVEIRLDSGDSLTTENAAVWTFGHHGYKTFCDGKIKAHTTDAPMVDGNSIIVLLQLKKGVLSPIVKKETSFKETVKRTALEGSDYDLNDAGLGSETSVAKNGDRNNGMSSLKGDKLPPEDDSEPDISLVVGILVVIGIVVSAIIATRKDEKKWKKLCMEKLAWVNEIMGGKSYNEMPYYRDLPMDGNLLMSGAVLGTVERYLEIYKGNKMNVTYGAQQLYEAFMLRMIYKKQISFDYDEADGKKRKLFRISEPEMPAKSEDVLKQMEGEISRTRDTILDEALMAPHVLEMMKKFEGHINDAGVEYYLQKMLYEAADEDHLLQPGELKAYVNRNLLEWRPLATMIYELSGECVAEKHMKKENVTQVVGFLHYLKDFSLVAERNIKETALWKEYLVYASFYGIADQVRKDMEKMAPDMVRLDDMLRPEEFIREFEPLTDELDDIIKTAYLYQTKQEADMIYERELERERQYERSSGGSGSSSYGGGGGHSGGGGSGIR